MSEPENRPEQSTALIRTVHGQFTPGRSGNPGGRPKIPPEVLELLRLNAVPMLQQLLDLAENAKKAVVVNGMVQYVDDDALRASILNSLMDRAIGKPPQKMEVEGAEGTEGGFIPGIVFLPVGGRP